MPNTDTFKRALETLGPLDLGPRGPDNDRFVWAPGTVDSLWYNQLATEDGDQLFEPFGYPHLSLVPATWGTDPFRSVYDSNRDSVNLLSGPQWVSMYTASKLLTDLNPTFAIHVQAFINAIVAAGGTVKIVMTRISAQLAYLMHWAYEIANGNIASEVVDDKHRMPGVHIQWDHGSDQSSIAAAAQMNTLYGTVYPPAIKSSLITGNGISMIISGLVGKIVTGANGVQTLITIDTAINPTQLANVGASYGVFHLSQDPTLWSTTGY